MASNCENMDHAKNTTDFIQNAKNVGTLCNQSGDRYPENQIDFEDHRECHSVVDDCPMEETNTNDQNSKSIPSPPLPLGKSEERGWTFKEVANKIVRLQNHCRRFTERDEWKDFTSVNVLFQH